MQVTQDRAMSWHDCFRCRYSSVSLDACEARNSSRPHFAPCARAFGKREMQAVYNVLSAGHYAAQLAWWLQFFPPERFMVVTSAQLVDNKARTQVQPNSSLHLLIPCDVEYLNGV